MRFWIDVVILTRFSAWNLGSCWHAQLLVLRQYRSR
ncbi:hypothetical protein Gotri_027226 [Gossypium trilobum]|uniref:Uncharacterized protein n=1 Tax=Gossypium trilobum TaxID=34281 RepID=A0A7J9FM62_9ROSI|nr:hypothetical protein [Gossypium trilobum]